MLNYPVGLNGLNKSTKLINPGNFKVTNNNESNIFPNNSDSFHNEAEKEKHVRHRLVTLKKIKILKMRDIVTLNVDKKWFIVTKN